MNYKTIIQFFLFICLFLLLYMFIDNYFFKQSDVAFKQSEVTNIYNSDIQDMISEETSANIIEKLEYNTIDSIGNKYLLKAKYGEVKENNKNILKLTNVRGKIELKEKSPIFIFSDFANYNSINHDTKFYNNVIVNYQNNNIKSDNLDLFFANNNASMYNNIMFINEASEMEADQINLDFLTGDVNISMFNDLEKVKISKK